jgi:cytochrome c-type biogenesis protein CcmF
MIPEIGHFASILALLVAIVQAAVPMIGVALDRSEWIAIGMRAARAQFLLLLSAFSCLAFAFVTNDFTVLNVAGNSHSQLPTAFRFAATWGSHEGSLLLWILMLASWTAAVSWFSRGLPAAMLGRVLGVLGALSTGFLLFMLLTSNPFLRVVPAPSEGLDLNPALQDAAMVLHPPLLYMGYVGFSVAFAFAIAALLDGRLDAVWARWSRPWATFAWMFLTCGIALGSYWAYYELGWGGWWFWDPVENASFMPWLAGTALIHSLAVTDRRGVCRSWTVLLAIATFSLSLLGAFLVRSGVLTSVHAFAIDPTRGVFLLCFLTIVIGGSLALYAVRVDRAAGTATFQMISRESFLLLNNVFLSVAATAVLLGTLYPLFIDVLGIGKLSVGPPYFNTVFVSVMSPAMFFLGIGPMARWRNASLPQLAVRLRWALAASVMAAVAIPLAAGEWKPLVSLGLLLALWIVTTIAVGFSEAVKTAGGWRDWLSRPQSSLRGFYGMQVAHAGVAVAIIGVTIVTGYQDEKDLRMAAGDQARVGGYAFTLRGMKQVNGPNYLAAQADIEVSRQDGSVLRTLGPQKRVYLATQNAMTETAIDSGVFRDLYVSLGEPLGNGAWQVRIQYKPFVDWIWFGAILMALGGALAASDPRYARVVARSSAPAQLPERSGEPSVRTGLSGARS